ncbi:MAG: hypothetical protein KJO07_03880 [Deltaproteobacteria bacterium]|jgi:hypothetical protein|nr:hypothetical protein [Deltaproteobacteria bacterium]
MDRQNQDRTEPEKGAISVEYIALLSLVTLIGAASVVGLGIPLLKLFRYAETIIALPMP